MEAVDARCHKGATVTKLVDPSDVKVLGDLAHFMTNVNGAISNKDNDALREFYHSLSDVESGTFIARCFVVAELKHRMPGDDERATLQWVADWLDIQYQYARQLSSVYELILKPIREGGQDIPELPFNFFLEAAMRSRKYGVNPVDALMYAVDRKIKNKGYTGAHFINDIKAGLAPADDAEIEKEASCIHCSHMCRANEDVRLVLMDEQRKLAEGPGAGTYYCAAFAVTKEHILSRRSLKDQAQRCIEEHVYQKRG